jgi:prolyl oligopeptidase
MWSARYASLTRMMQRIRILLLVTGTLAVVVGSAQPADRLGFSAARKQPVVDRYFGVEVRDDYQWLENLAAPAVRKWWEKQDARTRRWFERQPQRAMIRQQLSAWMRDASPSHEELLETSAGLFAFVSAPGKQQGFIVRLSSLDDPAGAAVVVDPNTIDPTGATAIDWWVPSRSGQRIAVCLSQRGSEAGTLHFYDAMTGASLPDRIERVQFPTAGGSAAWTSDESGVFYTRYPSPGERPPEDERFFQQVFLHRLGTDPTQDVYAIGREFPRIAEVELSTTRDGLFTLATVAHGDGGDFSFYLLAEGGAWERVATPDDQVKKARLGDDGMLYLLLHQDAPRGRILRTPLERADVDSATEVAPQTDAVIRDFAVHQGRVYAHELVGGPSQLRQYSVDGSSSRPVPLPDQCGISALVPRDDGSLLVRLARYVEPSAWYEFNPARSMLRKTALANTAPVDFSDVRVERVLARAADGVEVPITLLAPKKVTPGTPAPLLLQGYGAYGAVNAPGFVTHWRLWFDAGGVIAIAHVRGGGEFGATWHKAGNLAKKQTTFSDFAACAQRLIELGWTRSDRLAIQGGSAGGLLMGAALTQHPELFRAVVARVGVFDALRSERAPNGEFNTTEFGTVTDREQFGALRVYSPYHRVTNGTKYPAVLLTTGVHDGRVPAWHSFKMAARLQTATTSAHPVLLRVDAGSGHGMGRSRSSQLEERADVYAFLFVQLGMTMGR